MRKVKEIKKKGIHSLLIPLHILRENCLTICFSVSQAQISFMWATPTCQSTFCQSEGMWKPSIFIFMVTLSALIGLQLAFRNSKCHGCFSLCLRIYSSRYTGKVKDLFISDRVLNIIQQLKMMQHFIYIFTLLEKELFRLYYQGRSCNLLKAWF